MHILDFADIAYDRDEDGIVTVTFNTPERKNALSARRFWSCAGHWSIYRRTTAHMP